MATSQQYLCDVCMSQHITQTAIICCPECEENFCEKCKVHHEFAKATKKHEVISIENVLKLPRFVQDIKITCSDHEERFFVYCDDHGVPCCAHCLQHVHAGCRNLIPIQKLTQNVKESSLLSDLETTLSDLLTNITNIIEDRTANLQDLDEQKNRCKKEITTAREAINAYFDELETELMNNLQKTFAEKELEIQNILENFQIRKSNVCEMQDNVNIVKSIASEFQSFMAMRALAQSANITETDLQHLFDGGSFNWVKICYAPTNLNSIKDNLTAIGKPELKIEPSRIALKVRKTQQAQLIGPGNSSGNIESIQFKEKFKSKLPEGKYEFDVLDCVFLPDGYLIFSDRNNNRLVILDCDCVFVRNMMLSFSPIRFAVLDKENVAVTTKNQINIVDMINGDVVKTLLPGEKARSIAQTDDKHLLVEILGAGYKLIDLKGNIKKVVHFGFSATVFYKPVCIKEKLYYVDSSNAILYCYDFDGNKIWELENELFRSTLAFTSDKSNVLFCSGYTSNNVFVVLTDGKSSKEIIKSNMFLNHAVAAHYNMNNRELLITSKNGNFILYDVI